MANTTFTDVDVLYGAYLHLGERRRERMSAYYVCKICDNQFFYGVPEKTRKCPVCAQRMHLVSVVDEFEINRIEDWSDGLALHTKNLTADLIGCFRKLFFTRTDIGSEMKRSCLFELRKELC